MATHSVIRAFLLFAFTNIFCENATSSLGHNVQTYENATFDIVQTSPTSTLQLKTNLNSTVASAETLFPSTAGQLQNHSNVTFDIVKTLSTFTPGNIVNFTDILVDTSTAQHVGSNQKSTFTFPEASVITTSMPVESFENSTFNTVSTSTIESVKVQLNSTHDSVQTLVTSTLSPVERFHNITVIYEASTVDDVERHETSTESIVETSPTSTFEDIQSYDNATATVVQSSSTLSSDNIEPHTDSTFSRTETLQAITNAEETTTNSTVPSITTLSSLATQPAKHNRTVDLARVSPESLEIVSKCFRATVEMIQTKSVQHLVKSVLVASEVLKPAMAVIADIVDLFFDILGDPIEQEILNELRNIDNKLDMLRAEIEHLLAEISLEISFDQIATQVTQLNNVKGQYSEWLKYAEIQTESRTQRFLLSCDQNGITDKPNFFYRIFVGNDDVRHPREQVIGFGATKKYQKFASSMVAHLLQAALLSGVCSGLKRSTTDIEVTIKQDAAIYGGYLNQITNVMTSDDLQIKSRFWINALHELDDHLTQYSGRSHSEFANAFHQHLTDKYDYRDWLVISYGDEDFFGGKYHWSYPKAMDQIYNNTDRSTFYKNIVRTSGRNVILASPNTLSPNCYPAMFSELANACFTLVNNCQEDIYYPEQLAHKLKVCPMGPGFDPVIRFAFLDYSGYAIENNSPLAVTRWMPFLTSWGRYDFVSVLIA